MPDKPRCRRRSDGPHQTIDAVSRGLGVSTATVSRALNNKPGVGPALRTKILAAIKDLHYVPRAAARSLSRARSDTIAVALQDLTAGWSLTIFRGIMSRTVGKYHLLTSYSMRAGDELEVPRSLLAERRIDGLIWLDMRVRPAMACELARQPVPFVVLQHEFTDRNINTITIDAARGMREATEHLLQRGYRKLVLLTGPPGDEESLRKMSGVEQALAEHGVNVPPENILAGHHVGAHAVRVLSEYLDGGHALPEAILAFNDAMAIAVLHWLRGRGIQVPRDVALVGYDGIEEAAYVGLTTVETPLYEMGVLAAQTVMDIIERRSPEPVAAKQLVLQGSLRVRESCGADRT